MSSSCGVYFHSMRRASRAGKEQMPAIALYGVETILMSAGMDTPALLRS